IINERKKLLAHKLKQLEAEKSKFEFVLSEATIMPEQEALLNQLVQQIKQGIDKINFEQKRQLLQILKMRVDVIDKRKVKLTAILPIIEDVLDLDTFAAPSTR
ncbi:MAG: hypothetical protein M3Q45_02870, partial [Chloroflexota bacterium]|nr:hypothetical protein [Chloroflexota bacterium]